MSSDRVCPGHGCGRPVTDGYLCRTCQHRTEKIIGDLPALAREVEITVSRQDRVTAGGRRAPGAEQPLPGNLTASDRARRHFDLLFEWADAVAAWHGVKGLPIFTSDKPLTDTVPTAAAILLKHSDWMRKDPQGPDLASAMWWVQRRVRAVVDSREQRVYAGPCRADLGYSPDYRCGNALYRAWGKDTITCDGYEPDPRRARRFGCGTVHQAADRHEFLVASVADQLLPLKLVWESLHVLIPGCDVAWKTADQWTRTQTQRIETRTKNGNSRTRVHRTPPRLPQAGVDILGRPLYRGADILALAADTDRRRGRRRSRRGEVA